MRVVHQRERDAPICHGACGISLDGLLKDLLGIGVPEGVLIAHAAIEATLRNVVAGGLEVHVAELLIDIVLRTTAEPVGKTATVTPNRDFRMAPPFDAWKGLDCSIDLRACA